MLRPHLPSALCLCAPGRSAADNSCPAASPSWPPRPGTVFISTGRRSPHQTACCPPQKAAGRILIHRGPSTHKGNFYFDMYPGDEHRNDRLVPGSALHSAPRSFVTDASGTPPTPVHRRAPAPRSRLGRLALDAKCVNYRTVRMKSSTIYY